MRQYGRLLARELAASVGRLVNSPSVRGTGEVGVEERRCFGDRAREQVPVAVERDLFGLARRERSPVALAAGMTAMLALLARRFGAEERRFRPEWEISRMGGYERLSLDVFLRSLQRHLAQGTFTIESFVHWIYRDYVIRQHEHVALDKLPQMNTFRVDDRGNRVARRSGNRRRRTDTARRWIRAHGVREDQDIARPA